MKRLLLVFMMLLALSSCAFWELAVVEPQTHFCEGAADVDGCMEYFERPWDGRITR